MDYPQNLSKSDCRWFDLIHKCRTSGKSDNQWMLENNIKPPTSYYHVKQLRKKACEIPKSTNPRRNDIQEVVPLFVEEPANITSVNVPINAPNDTVSVRLNIKGVSVEIANNAAQEVIKNTFATLHFLC